jgi:phosphoribosylanthranilate isomerase
MERYIGVTGFKTKDEIDACDIATLNSEPKVMYGFLTSRKSFANIVSEGTRRPALINLANLLESVPKNALPTIHHCTENRDVSLEIDALMCADYIYDRGLCRAIQINQRLPEVNELEKIKKKYSNLKFILQLEPEDLLNPKHTGKIVNNYDGIADYVIIDPSRGIGITLDMHNSLDVLKELRINAMPVIAGGLNSSNVRDVISFFRKEYGNNFCIDAEGKLRDESDALVIKKMQSYIKESYLAYR